MPLHDRDYMRDAGGHRWSEIMWPDAVTTIIIINVVVFLVQFALGIGSNEVMDPKTGRVVTEPWGALSVQALFVEGRVWTVFTHLFVHGGIFHVAGNCLLIFFAGKAVQSLIGPRHFLQIYFLSGVVAAFTELLAGWLMGEMRPMVGASGAAFGTLLALAVMLPQEMITAMLYFVIPVRMKLWTLAMVMVGLSAFFAVLQATRLLDLGVANFAHLGGALAGWWFVRLLGYGGPPVTYEHMWHERQRREEKRAYAGVSSKRQRNKDRHDPASDMPPLTKKQLIEQEIDPILDKIAAHGMESLSDEERRLLAKASDQVRKHKG
jgi:membrane associated rhomboid family serine protease